MKNLTPSSDHSILQKWRSLPAWNRWVLIILCVLTIPALFSSSPDPEPLTAEQARKAQIEAHFSKWNGAHEGLESLVKADLVNPDSYEHIKTEYWDKGDHLVVNMTYRADSVIGASVQHFIKASAGLDGNVIQVLEIR